MSMVEYFTKKVGWFFSSVDELNRLMFDRVEQGAELYISFLAHSTKVSLLQFRALCGVHNMKSAQRYIFGSTAVGSELVKKTFHDAELLLAFLGDTKDQALGIITRRGDADGEQK